MDYKSSLLYAKLWQFQHLLKKTEGFIRWSLQQVENPYIACSFGKDSAVMLHLVHSIDPNIKVRFIRWDGETEHIDNYDEIISEWNLTNLEQVILSRESLSDRRKERYNTNDYDSFFVGLRKEESTIRRISILKHGMFYRNSSGLYRVCPLADWTSRDIAAYMYSRNLPVLNSYKQHGVDSRTSSRIPREDFGIRSQFVVDLKKRDFEAFKKLTQKFPELKTI